MDIPYFWELFIALLAIEFIARIVTFIRLLKTHETPRFLNRKIWGFIILFVYFGWVVYAVMSSYDSKRN